MPDNWCLIESDPAVFTELLELIGVKGLAVEDIVSLCAGELEEFSTVYGLVLLSKWKPNSAVPPLGPVVPEAPVYFARQTVENACATLAIVNTLCNYPDRINLGPSMQNFLTFTQELDSETRGMQVGEYEPLRTAHNSFAPPTAFENEGPSPKDADAYHFVSFIYRNGSIWMLDGLQSGPIRCSTDTTAENYKAEMIRVAQEFIERNSALDTSGTGQGISFCLMAIVDDPIMQLEQKIAEMRVDNTPTTRQEMMLAELREMRERGRKENIRRRHNYYPTIIALLKALAEKDLLDPILEEAKAKKAQSKPASS